MQLTHLYCGNDITQDYQTATFFSRPDRSTAADHRRESEHRSDRRNFGAQRDEPEHAGPQTVCPVLRPPTRKAIFEFDKLIRSIYTLDYLRDPQLQRDVHRSQNRIEAYHQLRAPRRGQRRKQLIGATDLDVAISNQCGRLTANVIIAYNSILLSDPVGTVSRRRRQEGASRCCGRFPPWLGSTSTSSGTTCFAAAGSQSTL